MGTGMGDRMFARAWPRWYVRMDFIISLCTILSRWEEDGSWGEGGEGVRSGVSDNAGLSAWFEGIGTREAVH